MTQANAPDGGFLYRTCAPGEQVPPNDRLLIVSADAGPRRYLPPGTDVPPEGRWVCICTAEMTARFGLADLTEYRVRTMPGQTFRLGFFGSLRLRFAHLIGLSSLMDRAPTARPEHALIFLREDLRTAVSAALRGRFGTEPPEYSDLSGPLLPELTAAVDRSLFAPLFRAGLCMTPGSLRIEKLSTPVTEL